MKASQFETWIGSCTRKLRQRDHNETYKNDDSHEEVDKVYRILRKLNCDGSTSLPTALFILDRHRSDSASSSEAFEFLQLMVADYKNMVTTAAYSLFKNKKDCGHDNFEKEWLESVTLGKALRHAVFEQYVDRTLEKEQRRWSRLCRLFERDIQPDSTPEDELPKAGVFANTAKKLVEIVTAREKLFIDNAADAALLSDIKKTRLSKCHSAANTLDCKLNFRSCLDIQRPALELYKNDVLNWLHDWCELAISKPPGFLNRAIQADLDSTKLAHQRETLNQSNFEDAVQKDMENHVQHESTRFAYNTLHQLDAIPGDECFETAVNNEITELAVELRMRASLDRWESALHLIKSRYSSCIKRDICLSEINMLLQLQNIAKPNGLFSSLTSNWRTEFKNALDTFADVWSLEPFDVRFAECDAFDECLKSITERLTSMIALAEDSVQQILNRCKRSLTELQSQITADIRAIEKRVLARNCQEFEFEVAKDFQLPASWLQTKPDWLAGEAVTLKELVAKLTTCPM